MKITHHDLVTELNDEWWAEAGMHRFVPTSQAYRTDQDAIEVHIADIGPVDPARRMIGIFRDNIDEGITARYRVLRILRGFRLGEAVPPVEVAEGEVGYGHQYRLKHGTHRLYCAIAAAFTRVPTVMVERG